MFSPPIDAREWELMSTSQLVVPSKYRDHLEGILIPGGLIKDRVRKLAEEVSNRPYDGPIVMICMLKGALDFYVALRSRISHKSVTEVLGASSYDKDESTGEVKFYGGFDPNCVTGRDTVIVEDIVDTGLTLDRLQSNLRGYNPRSLTTICLLEKPDVEKKAHPKVDGVGFIVPPKFVVGAGLDFDGEYRDLYHLGVLKKDLYKHISGDD